jgi:hypothetical protein
MTITFECQSCGRKLKAPDGAAGKSSKCPGCGALVTCPAPASTASPPPTKKPAAPPPPPPDEFDDRDPYALVEPEPDPYAPPRAAPEEVEPTTPRGRPGGKGKKRAKLRKIAVAQKGILIVILLQIAAYAAMLLLPPQYRLVPTVAYIFCGLASLYFMFTLAMNLYSTASAVLLCILTIIPCLGLIILLTMNGKATAVLREAGHHVGFLGADLSEFPTG